MTKIIAPAKGSLPAEFQTTIGSVALTFHKGEATHDGDMSEGVKSYLLAAGYTVDGNTADPAEHEGETALPVVDARDATGEQVGTRLRDGAVDPAPGDFLGPVNAGEADPHGPQVANPGIHAEGERIVRPGVVAAPDQQDQDEKELAGRLLVDNTPVTDADIEPDYKPANMGPLGLSDPASAAVGVKAAEDGQPADGTALGASTEGSGNDAPKGNASRDDWATYARTQGAPDSEVAPVEDGGLSRDDLRARYGE